MVGGPQTSGAALLPTDKGFTLIGSIVLLVPALISACAVFAPTTRGPWIAAVFLLPSLLFIAIRGVERRGSGYRIATAAAVLPLAGILGLLAAALLAFAFLGLGSFFLWLIWGALSVTFFLGVFVGNARHDVEEQKRLIRKRYEPKNSRLVINASQPLSSGMRDSTGFPIIDMALKVIWWLYAGLIAIGVLLAGSTAYVLIDILDGIFALSSNLDIRVLIIEGIALIAAGPVGVVMPSLWRGWREIYRLEGVLMM